MFQMIEHEMLHDITHRIMGLPGLDLYDAFIGFGSTAEVMASSVSLAKGKPCISSELIERSSDNMSDVKIRLLIIYSKDMECEELLESIRQYRVYGFLIGSIVSLDPVEPETGKELKMLGVNVLSVSGL